MTPAAQSESPSGFPSWGAPLLAGVFLLYLPLVFFSYGTDGDMYAVLETGRGIFERGVYEPSRIPGYPVHEFFTGLLDQVGGNALSNLGTLCMLVLSLGCFLRLGTDFRVPHLGWLTGIFVVHPLVWANATATADFFWAIGFVLLGLVVGLRGHFVIAGVLFGLAIGARHTSALAIAGVLLFFLFTRWPERWRWVASGAVMALVTFAVFTPSLSYAGWTLSGFGEIGQGGSEYWGLKMTLGRYAYKNLIFWGIPAFVLLPVLGWFAWKERGPLPDPAWKPLLWLCCYEVVAYQLMFMYFPFKHEYLLPALPFFLLAAGILLREHRRLLVALLLLVASANLVSFDVARPNVAHHATDASYGFWIDRGYLQREISARLRVTHCETRRCFADDRGEPM